MDLIKDWASLLVGILGVFAGIYATRASRAATQANREANQIKWLQEARAEADATKKELREVRDEADEARGELSDARRDLAAAKRNLTDATDVIEELSRWALKCITWAADPGIDREELRRLINGGPAYLRQQRGDGTPG
jgi:uncharacterized coiled-coil DUF342 family protein